MTVNSSIVQLGVDFQDSSSGPEAWDRYIETRPDATFFHLRGWQRVIERSFPYRPMSLVARRGEEICGVLPLYEVRTLPFGRSLVSVPMGVYGGICADDAEVERAILDRARSVAEERGVRYLELRNLEPIEGLLSKDLYATFRREIFENEEKNMAAIPRNQRRSIRIGKKNGLESRIGGAELLDGFYDVYAHSLHNLGSPVYPKRFFRALLEEFGEASRILAVFRGEEMLAAVLTFFFRDQVMPYYGGAYRHAYKLSVYDFMYWRLLCHGAENGFKVFDFGRSKRGTGSFDFKRHWGFEPQQLHYQYHLVRQKEIPNISPANPKFSLPIRVWKRLPVAVTRWIGPRVVRFFP